MFGLTSAFEGTLTRARQPFMMHAHTSPRAGLWLGALRAFSLPLQSWGAVHHYRATSNGTEIKITCVGFERRFADLLDSLFGLAVLTGTGRRRAAWRVRDLSRIDSDVIFVDVHELFVPAFRKAGWLIVPEDVSWQGDLNELPPSRPSKSLRSDMAKVQRFGYELEEAGSNADWTEFIDKMLLPHARNRYGDRARLPSGGTQRHLRRNAELLFVRRDGVRVAGGCVLQGPDAILLDRLGVRHGDADLIREGALSAVFLLTFDWARARGYARFDAGTTLPLPEDSVARFKSKLGLAPAPNPLALKTAMRLRHGSANIAETWPCQPVYHLMKDHIVEYPPYRVGRA